MIIDDDSVVPMPANPDEGRRTSTLPPDEVEEVVATPEEKMFLSFLLCYIIEYNPKAMQLNLLNVSKHMREKLPQNGPENKYRKKFGNLKDLITRSDCIMSCFNLVGTCFRIKPWADVVTANEAGYIEPETWLKLKTHYAGYLAQVNENRSPMPEEIGAKDADSD